MSRGNLKAVSAAMDKIVEPGVDQFDVPNGRRGGPGGHAPKAMPDDCPVIPVGTWNGTYYFLDALGQLRELAADKVANKHIVSLFSPYSEYLIETWARRKLVAQRGPDGKALKDEDDQPVMEWVITGWDTEVVTNLLMDVASQQGVWDAREKVRGRGAWRHDDGSLILHCGNHLWIEGRWARPGMHEGLVYPTMPAMPRPAGDPRATCDQVAPELAMMLRARGVELAADASPARALLELFKTFNWERALVDPVLMLGWNGVAKVGGALDYRPLAWITGDTATGKSSLQKLIGWLHEGSILQSPDTSAAGVRQVLGQQSLPVGIDEGEPDERGDSRKMHELIKLARLAATSQGNILRGGQDHKGHEFRATSCFLFSSILVPPIPPQDRNRLAVLELNELPAGAREPRLDKREMIAIGQWMTARIASRWREWPLVLEAFTDALVDYGKQGGRAAGQFGSLRAAAWMLLEDGMPDEDELEAWGRMLGADVLAETAGQASDGEQCIDRLATQTPAMQGHGMPRSIADWVAQAVKPIEMLGMIPNPDDVARRRAAEDFLDRFGLKPTVRAGAEFLAVATSHEGLAKLFEGTRWAGGTWSQALGRIKGAVKDQPRRISHKNRKCTLVPIDAVWTPEEATVVVVPEPEDADVEL